MLWKNQSNREKTTETQSRDYRDAVCITLRAQPKRKCVSADRNTADLPRGQSMPIFLWKKDRLLGFDLVGNWLYDATGLASLVRMVEKCDVRRSNCSLARGDHRKRVIFRGGTLRPSQKFRRISFPPDFLYVNCIEASKKGSRKNALVTSGILVNVLR